MAAASAPPQTLPPVQTSAPVSAAAPNPAMATAPPPYVAIETIPIPPHIWSGKDVDLTTMFMLTAIPLAVLAHSIVFISLRRLMRRNSSPLNHDTMDIQMQQPQQQRVLIDPLKLPILVFQPNPRGDVGFAADTCRVCFAEFLLEQDLHYFPCRHAYHLDYIRQLIDADYHRYPDCREPIV